MPRPVDIESRAKLLAEAYTYLQHIDELEDEIVANTGTLPRRLIDHVHTHAFHAVGLTIGGKPAPGCPWDTGDLHPLRRALARYWHELFEDFMEQYRSSAKYRVVPPRLIDEYQADDWDPVRPGRPFTAGRGEIKGQDPES